MSDYAPDPPAYRVVVLTSSHPGWFLMDRRVTDCEGIVVCSSSDNFVPAILHTNENVILTLSTLFQ